jgi:hypothetical protein
MERRSPEETPPRHLVLDVLLVVGTPLLVMALAFLILVGAFRAIGGAIGDAVCSSYNFISNDFCDRWHYEPPPEQAFPLPPGWTILSQHLDCGSGGCPTRVYVLRSPASSKDAVRRFVDEVRRMGWTVTERDGEDHFVGRMGDLEIVIEPTSKRSLTPRSLRDARNVAVSFWDRAELRGDK